VERLWDASMKPPKLEASEEARERESGTPDGDKLPQRARGSRSVMEERVLSMVRKAGCDTERAILRVSTKGQKAGGYCGERCRVLAGCRLVEVVGRQVPDKSDGLTPYKWSDLWYDLSLGRLPVAPDDVADYASVDWYDRICWGLTGAYRRIVAASVRLCPLMCQPRQARIRFRFGVRF
jgi:hypothetical protein